MVLLILLIKAHSKFPWEDTLSHNLLGDVTNNWKPRSILWPQIDSQMQNIQAL